MKEKMIRTLVMAVAVWAVFGTCTAAETATGEDPEKVAVYAGKVMKILTVDNLDKLMGLPVKFYFGGASFQKSLLAPLDKVGAYGSDEARRVMSAVYYTDGAYAHLCRKKKLAGEYFKAWDELTLDFITALCPDMKTSLYKTTLTILKKYRKESPKTIQKKLAELMVEGNRKLVNSSLGIEVVVDSFYGTFIEVIFLSVNMILTMDPSDRFLYQVGNAAKYQVAVAYDLITNMAADTEYSELCNVSERQKVIRALSDALAKKIFTLADMEKVNAIVKPVRAAMVAME